VGAVVGSIFGFPHFLWTRTCEEAVPTRTAVGRLMDPRKERMLTEHLIYEIDMLRASVAALDGPGLVGPPRNMAIETFWLHARNLIQFFNLRKNVEDTCEGVASAKDFTDNNFQTGLQLGTLEDLINYQICHLQYGRASNADEKLGGCEIWRVKDALEREITKFESHLTDEARPLWEAKPRFTLSDAFLASDTHTTSVMTSFVTVVHQASDRKE
jgi:hypothetical protein